MQKAKTLSQPSCKLALRLKQINDISLGNLKPETKFSHHPSNSSVIVKHNKLYMAVKTARVLSRNISPPNNQLIASVKISTGSSKDWTSLGIKDQINEANNSIPIKTVVYEQSFI